MPLPYFINPVLQFVFGKFSCEPANAYAENEKLTGLSYVNINHGCASWRSEVVNPPNLNLKHKTFYLHSINCQNSILKLTRPKEKGVHAKKQIKNRDRFQTEF